MSPFEIKQKHLKGTIWTMIVIGLMVLALLILVMNSDRSKSSTSLDITETAIAFQAEATANPDSELDIVDSYPLYEPPVVNINGILMMGGVLVFVVLFAVLREAILHRKS